MAAGCERGAAHLAEIRVPAREAMTAKMGAPNRVACESAPMSAKMMPAAVAAEAVTSAMTVAATMPSAVAAAVPSSMAAALGDGIA
jgi:hypothetical protein